MKLLINYLQKAFPMVIVVLIAGFSSCKKDQPSQPGTPKTELTTTVDGKSFVVAQSGITANRFEDSGDTQKSIEINASLDNAGNQMSFFIADLKEGSLLIEPKTGTSAAPKQKNNISIKETVLQNYIRFTYNGNVYYAIRGSINVKLNGNLLTYTWDITFKDAAGKEFNSKGSITITITDYTVKPKSEVKDPTPVSAKPTVENISPGKGMAGTEVSINGTNFSTTKSENIVKFNNIVSEVKSATSTKLVVISPVDGKTGAITVKVKNSETTTGPIFTYLVQPTITELSPASGRIGDTLKIIGTHFSTIKLENQVMFTTATPNYATGEILGVSETSIYVRVPAGATTGVVKVTANELTATAASGINTMYTILAPVSTAYTGFTRIDGAAEFRLLYQSQNDVKVLYLDKKQSILYYSTGGITDYQGTGLYKINVGANTASTVFNTDARLTNISAINSDAQGNVFVTCERGFNDVTSKFKLSIFKVSFDGTTVTPVMENVDNTIEGTAYFQINNGGSVFFSNKKFESGASGITNVNYGQIPCTNMTSYGLYFTAGNLGFKRYNMDLNTSETLSFNVQSLFAGDDTQFNTNSLKEFKYAFDNESNFYGFYEKTPGLTAEKRFVIRKAKSGVTGSTMISSFSTSVSTTYPSNGIFNGVLRTMDVDAKGNIYVVNNRRDIVKITY